MSTNRNDYLFRLLAGLPSAKEPLNLFSLATLASPREPVKWTQNYLKDVSERTNKRISVLQDRIAGVTTGRVMPDLEQVTIGSGKQYSLAVLFLDICSFSS